MRDINTLQNPVVALVTLLILLSALGIGSCVGPNRSIHLLTDDNPLGNVTNGNETFSLPQSTHASPLCTGCVTKNITVGNLPEGIAYDSWNGNLYVANVGSWDVSVINGSTNTEVGSIPMPNSESADDVAFDSSNGDVYVTSYGFPTNLGYVAVINGSTNAIIGTITVGSGAYGIAFDSVNGCLYVANADSGNVSVISGMSNKVVATIPVGDPNSVAYDDKNGDIYVTNETNFTSDIGDAVVISGSNNTVICNITVGVAPVELAVDNSTGFVYVVNDGSDSVSVINGTSNTVTRSVHVGQRPQGIAYDSANGYLYVANNEVSNISVIDSAQDWLVGAIQTGLGPMDISVDNANGYLYATNDGLNCVQVISPSSAPILRSVTVTPQAYTVPINGNVTFTANPVCTGGNCAPLSAYSWSLTNDLGSLNSSTGRSVLFAANSAVGRATMFVNSSFDGTTIQSAPVPITIVPALSSMSVSPSFSTVGVGETATFTANDSCTGGPCPPGASYTWLLNNSLGTLNATSDQSVTFTAGSVVGIVSLFANVTLNGKAILSSPATISIIPVISSIIVSPSSSKLPVGRTANFTASLTCMGGSCPPGTTYTWSLNNNLGTLNTTSYPTSYQSVEFSAGSTGGAVSLFANATLNGNIVQSAPVHITIVPKLSSVTITPESSAIFTGETNSFSASEICSGGPCPSGTTYSWSLSNSLAKVNTSAGRSAILTAGNTAGNVSLLAKAVLNGVTVQSQPASITIFPVLMSVNISPPAVTLEPREIARFGASPVCNGGACPSAVFYSWSLTRDLGALNATAVQTVTFTAGPNTGTITLLVNATLLNKTVTSSASITIALLSGTGTTLSKLLQSETFWILLIAVVVASAIVATVLVWRKVKDRSSEQQDLDKFGETPEISSELPPPGPTPDPPSAH